MCKECHGTEHFDSLDLLLASGVDAIYVATHPDSHAGLCIQALEAGKHVLCEKPAALNERQAAEVLIAGLGKAPCSIAGSPAV